MKRTCGRTLARECNLVDELRRIITIIGLEHRQSVRLSADLRQATHAIPKNGAVVGIAPVKWRPRDYLQQFAGNCRHEVHAGITRRERFRLH